MRGRPPKKYWNKIAAEFTIGAKKNPARRRIMLDKLLRMWSLIGSNAKLADIYLEEIDNSLRIDLFAILEPSLAMGIKALIFRCVSSLCQTDNFYTAKSIKEHLNSYKNNIILEKKLEHEKVGIVGKYGTRYGASLRKQIKKMEITQHAKYTCAFCGKDTVKRKAVGIWNCSACKKVLAGGAWTVSTTTAATVRSTVRRLRELMES
ncbi:15011_t:CDS:2 [Entrophospora sp. SA101]|nr:15011_t:CDS:2 [Entrophospora sp. SA101]